MVRNAEQEAAGRIDAGGLTAAAEEPKIAQSAVSRHVANLERELAVALFTRKGNRRDCRYPI
ncbi:LysR family transcriptional regulator [Mesorhizobium sp. M0991]|uniref:helix-turn-helix domain-containing protein n=1 Tax=Mesorhizobium sp. M0991 TaxID=2957043 RepID=UPI0033364B8F